MKSIFVDFSKNAHYGVAMMSRLLKISGFFCKRALSKRRYSAKETYNLKEPTNRNHPIAPKVSCAKEKVCKTYKKKLQKRESYKHSKVSCAKENVCKSPIFANCPFLQNVLFCKLSFFANCLFLQMFVRLFCKKGASNFSCPDMNVHNLL